MAIKFSDLQFIQSGSLASDDVFAVTDTSENLSFKIKFEELEQALITASTFTDHDADMVTALNAYASKPAASTTPLNAGSLGGSTLQGITNAYQQYVKDNAASSLSQLANTSQNYGVVSLDTTLQTHSLAVRYTQPAAVIGDPPVLQGYQAITTKNIPEDTSLNATNLYYSEEKVTDYFDLYFGSYYNRYGTTFDEGDLTDSFFDTVAYAENKTGEDDPFGFSAVPGTTERTGRWLTVHKEGVIPGTTPEIIREQANRFQSLQKNKSIRIYGAENESTNSPPTDSLVTTIDKFGFTTAVGPAVIDRIFNAEQSNLIANEDKITTVDTNGNPIPHGFVAGEEIIYSTNGTANTPSSALVNGAAYFVIPLEGEPNSFKIASSKTNATPVGENDPIHIVLQETGAVGSDHIFTPLVVPDGSIPFQRLTYTCAEFDLTTGRVYPADTAVALNIGPPATFQDTTQDGVDDIANYLVNDQDKILKDFGVENFIKLDFNHISPNGIATSGPSPNRGILVYRSVGQPNSEDPELQSNATLCAVLGPKDLETNSWIDYFNDDILDFSKKQQADNTYLPEYTVHFKPQEAPIQWQLGWVDRTIIQVVETDNFIRIKLSSAIYARTGQKTGMWISHNDTNSIRNAVSDNSLGGRKAIQLNAKNYITDTIEVPDNFAIAGFAYNTKLTRLPWSGYAGNESKANIFNRRGNSGAMSNVSLVGFDIDGNAINSIAFADSSLHGGTNYAINCGTTSDQVLIDKVRISHPIGGGVYASSGSNFRLTGSEIVNSGVTDRHVFSPLVADGGQSSFISSNRFQNFTDAVDASITDKGVVEGNIIAGCGSGLVVFGSRFMVTSPNVLTGSGDEFLPNPDAYNSEFDSINIDLTASSLDGGMFLSGPMKYQENGDVYDLSNAELTYRVFAIEKGDDGEETIWADNIIAPTVGGLDAEPQDTITIPFDPTPSGATISVAPINAITFTSDHGLTTGDPVKYVSTEAPADQYSSLDPLKTYYVNALTSNGIALYESQADALNNVTGNRVTLAADAGAGANHSIVRSVYLRLKSGLNSDNLKSEGGFSFDISPESVSRIKSSDGIYSYSYMSGKKRAGGIQTITDATTFTPMGASAFGSDGAVDVEVETKGLGSSAKITLSYTGSTGAVVATVSDFKGIDYASGDTISIPRQTIATALGVSLSDVVTTNIFNDFVAKVNTIQRNVIHHLDKDGNPTASLDNVNHVGLGWSASIRQYLSPAGIITSTASDIDRWSNQQSDAEGLHAIYTVKVKDYKYLTTGRKVKFTQSGLTPHIQFSPGIGAEQYGVIQNITPVGAEAELGIRWGNANANDDSGNPSATDGFGGTLEIEDVFVIATGRIK